MFEFCFLNVYKLRLKPFSTEISIEEHTVSQKIIRTPVVLILQSDFHNQGKIFSQLQIHHSIEENLYFILEKKLFLFRLFFMKLRSFFINRPISKTKKLFGHFKFFFSFSLVIDQNISSNTSFDRENDSLHACIF